MPRPIFKLIFLTLFTLQGAVELSARAKETKYVPHTLKKYHNYQDLAQVLTSLEKKYHGIMMVYSIGKSVQGRHLLVSRISTEVKDSRTSQKRAYLKPMVKIVANMHGNEVIGRELSIALVDYLLHEYSQKNSRIVRLLRSIDLHILHSMNPDGFEQSKEGACSGEEGRQNANNVDLNRNFPTFFDLRDASMVFNLFTKREPETVAVMKWIMDNPFVISLNLHDGAVVANYPFDDFYGKIDRVAAHVEEGEISKTPDHKLVTFLASKYAKYNPRMFKETTCPAIGRSFKNGVTNGADWYVVRGGMQDFNYIFTNCVEITIEMSCCKHPLIGNLTQEWRNNVKSFLRFFETAHMGIKGAVKDTFGHPISGAKIQIYGINHDVRATANGEYWRLLVPGTYLVRAQDPKTGKVSKITKVELTLKKPRSAKIVDIII